MGELSADDVIALLGLEPHHTCGFVTATFHSGDVLPAAALPARYGDAARRDRSLGTVLYFMVTADAHIVVHSIRSDQVYHHYLGAPLEVLLLYPDGRGETRVCGPDLAAGHRPQLFVPAGTVHVSRVLGGSGYALLGTSEWIEVDPSDVTTPDPASLAAAWPAMATEIERFVAGAPVTRPLARRG
mgnify:CR=1 FL=1